MTSNIFVAVICVHNYEMSNVTKKRTKKKEEEENERDNKIVVVHNKINPLLNIITLHEKYKSRKCHLFTCSH